MRCTPAGLHLPRHLHHASEFVQVQASKSSNYDKTARRAKDTALSPLIWFLEGGRPRDETLLAYWDFGFRITHSHRLLSSSFLGLLHKSLNISHRKELLGSLVVRPTGLRVPGLRFPVCRLTLLFDKVGFWSKRWPQASMDVRAFYSKKNFASGASTNLNA